VSRRRPPARIAGLLVPLVLAAGCGADTAGRDGAPAAGTAGTAGTAGSPTTGSASSVGGDGSDGSDGSTAAAPEVRVGVAEWDIVASSSTVPVGDVVLRVLNTGGTEHDVVARTPYGQWSTGSLAPGESAELEVVARPGARLLLICVEPGHPGHGDPVVLPVED
jgi:uncharacterized cupredoxin-like copper-binding protein